MTVGVEGGGMSPKLQMAFQTWSKYSRECSSSPFKKAVLIVSSRGVGYWFYWWPLLSLSLTSWKGDWALYGTHLILIEEVIGWHPIWSALQAFLLEQQHLMSLSEKGRSVSMEGGARAVHNLQKYFIQNARVIALGQTEFQNCRLESLIPWRNFSDGSLYFTQ